LTDFTVALVKHLLLLHIGEAGFGKAVAKNVFFLNLGMAGEVSLTLSTCQYCNIVFTSYPTNRVTT
jgi:hypothetical protein